MCYTDSVRSVGVDDGEVPPVPIPNTEVKLTCAEDSQLETYALTDSGKIREKNQDQGAKPKVLREILLEDYKVDRHDV